MQPNVPPFVILPWRASLATALSEAHGRKEPRSARSGKDNASCSCDCQPHGGRDRGRAVRLTYVKCRLNCRDV